MQRLVPAVEQYVQAYWQRPQLSVVSGAMLTAYGANLPWNLKRHDSFRRLHLY
jgi:hypothetical protein